MTKRTSGTRKQNQSTLPGGDELGWSGDSENQRMRRSEQRGPDDGFNQPTVERQKTREREKQKKFGKTGK